MKKPFLHLVLLLFVLNLFQDKDANAQAGMWTWVNGTNWYNSPGVFGLQGIPSPLNHPPAIYEPCEWQDLQGNFWLYGGYSAQGHYSDLWKYNPTSNEWTWIKGSQVTGAAPTFGTKGVPSYSNSPGMRIFGTPTWVDTTGSLWLYGGLSSSRYNDLWKYDISTNMWTWIHGSSTPNQSAVYGTQGISHPNNTPGSRAETSSTWVDANNNLWLFGGSESNLYYNDLWKYDPSINQWTWMKGPNTGNQSGVYGTKGVSNSNNIPGGRNCYSHWKDANGNFWIFGGFNNNRINLSDMWMYNVSTNNWTWMSGTNWNNYPGNYGQKCVPSVTKCPAARFENRCCWTDTNENFWMYGGRKNPTQDGFSDLWMFNPITLEWTFVSGDSTISVNAIYGTLGIPSPANKPGNRNGHVAWFNIVNQSLYFFGGSEYNGYKDDLWRYQINPNCPSNQNHIPDINLQSSDTTFCEKNCINFFDLSTNNPTSWQWYFPGASPDTSSLQNPTNICYNTYGNYDVTLIACNLNGCDSLHLTNFITCFQNPVDSIYQSNDTLYSLPAFSYQWYETTTGIIAGATNQFYVLSQPGSYFCVASDSVGCEATSNVVVITAVPPLSFGEGPGVRLHPNPNDGSFEIVWINEQAIKNAELRIVNAVGQVVFQLQLNTDHSLLTTHHSQIKTNLPNGIYSVSITTNKGIFTKRIEVLK